MVNYSDVVEVMVLSGLSRMIIMHVNDALRQGWVILEHHTHEFDRSYFLLGKKAEITVESLP